MIDLPIDMLVLTMAVFSTYRVSRMIASEDGPFNVFFKLRGSISSRFGYLSWQSRGIACPLCVSFWVSWIVVTTLLPYLGWRLLVLQSLGIAGIAAFLHIVSEKSS